MRGSNAIADRLARRYVWWQEPAETLAEPARLLQQILEMGTAEDYVSARRLWGEAALREALRIALPGAIGARSWNFWHLHFGLDVPPLPRRRFA